MAAPLVAITATTKIIDGVPRVRLNEAYVEAVRAVGLVPLVLPPMRPGEIEAVLDSVRGLVLSGGEDVAPSEYGAATSPLTTEPHRPRDRSEMALTRGARARGIPTLAICRGIQVANVALGGTLLQDIASEWPSALPHDRADQRTSRVHEANVDRGSRLAEALGASAITVNSSHHQSLATLAPGLRVVASAPDGIVEGAEWDGDDWWMLGVQWHPEELMHDDKPWDSGLFTAFAHRVRAFTAR